ncbi:MAG TPA: hypothetical protein VJ904_03960 [Tichowtungia sp.]|nr:hypothetical protein [Tichowtungia sp.]
MTQKIEVREVDDFADEPAKCPFCGTTALEFDEEGTSYELKPCPHLLFFCYDDGWDYLSDRAAKNLSELGYRVRTEDVIEVDEEGTDLEGGPDFISSNITIPGSIKLASYFGAPSCYGSYIGFAPIEDTA